VVQLYIAHPEAKNRAPIRALKGFQRVHLKAGETRQITFILNTEDLSLVNETNGQLYLPKGKINISIGGGQPGVNISTSSNVLTKPVSIQ